MDQKLDVFLLIGQSNMAGRGVMGEVSALRHSSVFMFREGQWIAAEEPLHTDKPEIAGVGLGMTFALEVLEAYPSGSVGLVPAAVGGTPLSRWMPGADLYCDAVAAAKEALTAGELKGVLWHQGEGDSHCRQDAESYGQRFGEIIAALRAELNASNIPFVAGELGEFLQDFEGCDFFRMVNRQLNGLGKTIPHYGCVSSAGLKDKGDHVHFDSASLREFGKRYAHEYLRIAKGSSEF